MIWSVDMDDFRGSCMGQPFPLINAVKEELRGYHVANLETAGSSNVIGGIGNKIGECLTLEMCQELHLFPRHEASHSLSPGILFVLHLQSKGNPVQGAK